LSIYIDESGRSALHAVCAKYSMLGNEGDRVDIAELLINKRCGVYDLDDAGQSALHAIFISHSFSTNNLTTSVFPLLTARKSGVCINLLH
jgi:hypothetical protein